MKKTLYTNKRSFGDFSRRQSLYGYLFVLPFLAGLLALFIPSVAESLYNCFFDVRLNFNSVSRSFLGLKNFQDAFLSDTEYRKVLVSTVRGMIVDTVLIVFFSFFVSSILNSSFKGRSLARTVFFLPVILSTGIIVGADIMVSSSLSSGLQNNAIGSAFSDGMMSFFDLEELLRSFELGAGLSKFIFYAIDNTYNIVNRSGVQILIFLSALQTIPASVFEASKMEGASKWE